MIGLLEPNQQLFWDEVDHEQGLAENKIEVGPAEVTLYVESDADIPFWYAVFKRFAPALKIEFAFYSLSAWEKPEETPGDLEDQENLNPKKLRGKHVLLKQARENPDAVGPRKLICVDSDYDYLIEDLEYTKTVSQHHPYIFQTYTYAIENYKCLAKSLAGICVDATYSTEHNFDFERFIKDYSEAVFDLFVYSVYSEKIGLRPSIKCRGNVGIGDCLSLENNGKKTIDAVKKTAQETIERAREMLRNSHPDFEEEIGKIRNKIESFGVKPENVYLFMDAHKLFKGVVTPLLLKAVGRPKRERHKEIDTKVKNRKVDNKTKNQWHEDYNKMMLHPVELLNVNKAHFYHDCPPMKCIERDINSYLEKHPFS